MLNVCSFTVGSFFFCIRGSKPKQKPYYKAIIWGLATAESSLNRTSQQRGNSSVVVCVPLQECISVESHVRLFQRLETPVIVCVSWVCELTPPKKKGPPTLYQGPFPNNKIIIITKTQITHSVRCMIYFPVSMLYGQCPVSAVQQ